MTNSDNQKYFIPMEVTKETIKDFNLDVSKVVKAKIGNKIVPAIMIPATKEQYDAYMQPLWAEMKREERSRRCMVSNGRGKLKRCDSDCKKCENMKKGATLSIEAFFEENELEFEYHDANHYGAILTAMIFEDLLEKLHSQEPELAKIFKMLYDGKSKRIISAIIGKPPSSLNYTVKRMEKIIQQHIRREDFSR